MKHAILIICHELTSALNYTVNKASRSGNVDVYLHLDKKSDISKFNQILGEKVFFVKNRVNVKWGHISQVDATISLLDMVDESKYDYVSLISGDDILSKSINELERFFIANMGKEYLGVSPTLYKKEYEKRVKFRYPMFFYERYKSNLSILKEKIFFILIKFNFFSNKYCHILPEIYKGPNWFTLTGDCIHYIKRYLDRNPNYLMAFKHSYCADEVFFHTIILNSHFKHNIYQEKSKNDNLAALRLIYWGGEDENPKVFGLSDFNEIKSSDAFFCRKIDKSISTRILESWFGTD